jgi:hypothetical protein
MDHTTFRAAVEARDLERMVAHLAPDAVLHSPVTFKPFEGRDAIRALFAILLDVFEDFGYTDELVGPDAQALIFRARVGDRQLEGVDILRFGPDGLIADFTVMVRPMSAVHALAEAVGARLAAQA